MHVFLALIVIVGFGIDTTTSIQGPGPPLLILGKTTGRALSRFRFEEHVFMLHLRVCLRACELRFQHLLSQSLWHECTPGN